MNKVSVPLRGKGRDQRRFVWTPDELAEVFPSPCGEKVGINVNGGRLLCIQLPSVSVPLRGKGRDQLVVEYCYNPCAKVGFRPLAGKR